MGHKLHPIRVINEVGILLHNGALSARLIRFMNLAKNSARFGFSDLLDFCFVNRTTTTSLFTVPAAILITESTLINFLFKQALPVIITIRLYLLKFRFFDSHSFFAVAGSTLLTTGAFVV